MLKCGAIVKNHGNARLDPTGSSICEIEAALRRLIHSVIRLWIPLFDFAPRNRPRQVCQAVLLRELLWLETQSIQFVEVIYFCQFMYPPLYQSY